MLSLTGPGTRYIRRWLEPPQSVKADASQAVAAVGRIYALWIEIPEDCQVAGVAYTVGAAAGNVRVAVYGPVTSITMAGAPLVVESASIPVVGAAAGQVVPVTPTAVAKGWYYICIAWSSLSASYYRTINTTKLEPGLSQILTTDQAFGAFPNPAGPMSTNNSGTPVMALQCQ